MARTFSLPIDHVLYEMSYPNLILYGATLPSYDGRGSAGTSPAGELINGDDPANRERLNKIFDESE